MADTPTKIVLAAIVEHLNQFDWDGRHKLFELLKQGYVFDSELRHDQYGYHACSILRLVDQQHFMAVTDVETNGNLCVSANFGSHSKEIEININEDDLFNHVAFAISVLVEDFSRKLPQ
jgi:hypothetical protein